jgi:hypothetical protein
MKINSKLLDELLEMEDYLEEPINPPEEGEIWNYSNLMGLSFNFTVKKRHLEHYDIMLHLDDEDKLDILPINYDLVSMINDGTLERKQEI